jgi:general stress protein 26
MVKDPNLQFIREKIDMLRSAVMYVASAGPVKLGNDIITAVKVDEEGQLWFVTNRPSQLVDECEQNFPARLNFYRKGVDYHMEISGKATIVNKDYSFNDNSSHHAKKLLVKLSMQQIEYTEPHARKPKTRLEQLLEEGYNWFLRTVSVEHYTGSVLKKLRETN